MKKDYVRVSATLYELQGGILVPHNIERRFKKHGITLIQNSLHKFMQVRKSSIAVLLFLAEQMDEKDNTIASNELLKSKFLKHLKNMGIKSVGGSSFSKAITELVNTDLLIQHPTRGLYTVNPRHIHKTTHEKREKMLKELMQRLNEDKWHKTNLLSAIGNLV